MIDQRTSDFLILTVLEIELRAVIDRLEEVEIVVDAAAGFAGGLPFVATARLRDDHDGERPYGIVALIRGMGRVSAAVASTILVERWRPRICILVGVAGGFASAGVALGDVIVATEVIDHAIHKVLGDDTETRAIHHQVDYQLLDLARRMAEDCRSPAHPTDRISRACDAAWIQRGIHFGPVSSGDRIIASRSLVDRLRAGYPALIGVEMESSGVLTALEHLSRVVPFLMIRGVADLADEHKSDVYLETAAQAAAGFAVDLLKAVAHQAERSAREKIAQLARNLSDEALSDPSLRDAHLELADFWADRSRSDFYVGKEGQLRADLNVRLASGYDTRALTAYDTAKKAGLSDQEIIDIMATNYKRSRW